MTNKVKGGIRTARANYYSNKFEEHQGDIKNTWEILKEIINNNKSTDIDCVIYNGETISDNQRLPETFNDHIISIGEKPAKDIPASSNDVDFYLRKLLLQISLILAFYIFAKYLRPALQVKLYVTGIRITIAHQPFCGFMCGQLQTDNSWSKMITG